MFTINFKICANIHNQTIHEQWRQMTNCSLKEISRDGAKRARSIIFIELARPQIDNFKFVKISDDITTIPRMEFLPDMTLNYSN